MPQKSSELSNRWWNLSQWSAGVRAFSVVALAALTLALPAVGDPPEADPYLPTSTAGVGPYKGTPMQPDRRPLVILEGAEAEQYRARPGDIVIANLNHEGNSNFVIASVPADAIKDVIMQTSSSTILGHTQFRIQFDQPVRLYHQQGNAAPRISETKDLVYSVDAAIPQGVDGVKIEGMIDHHYPRVHRFMTQYEDYYYRVMSRKRVVNQFRITFNDKEKQEFLREIFQTSQARQYNDVLGLCFGNCTSEGFSKIDSIASRNGTIAQRLLRMIPPIPLNQEWFLNLRGLVEVDAEGKPIPMSTVNDEFSELKMDPVLRDRFRALLAEAKAAKAAARAEADGNPPTATAAAPEDPGLGLWWTWRSKMCAPLLKMLIKKATAN